MQGPLFICMATILPDLGFAYLQGGSITDELELVSTLTDESITVAAGHTLAFDEEGKAFLWCGNDVKWVSAISVPCGSVGQAALQSCKRSWRSCCSIFCRVHQLCAVLPSQRLPSVRKVGPHQGLHNRPACSWLPGTCRSNQMHRSNANQLQKNQTKPTVNQTITIQIQCKSDEPWK